MRRTGSIALGVLCAGIVCIPFVYAHESGASWEEQVGEYLIDIGYEPEEFRAGDSIRFDFALKDSTGATENFDEVWVRIVDETSKKTALATGIRRQSVGPTTLLYAFGHKGPYSLEASYRTADGEEIAAHAFPVAVTPDQQKGPAPLFLIGIGALALAGLCVWIFGRRR
jgi:hypothetical protein